MRAQKLVDVLIDRGICDPADDEGLALSKDFRRSIARHEESLTVETARETLQDHMGEEWETDRIDVRPEELEFVAEFMALDELTDLTVREKLEVLHVLGQFPDPSDGSGAPTAFLQIPFHRLRFLLPFHRRALVYVWQTDCETCDVMRRNFDALYEEPPEGIGLFAINGPTHADSLYKEFNVYGAPTVLFVDTGRVDMRLLGVQTQGYLEHEIEEFVDLTSP